MPTHKICTICKTQPQTKFTVRCDSCQGVFNSLRVSDSNAKDGRRAPTAEQVRAAVVGGYVATASLPLKSAGHKAEARIRTNDPEVKHALGVLRDARAQREGVPGYVYLLTEISSGGGFNYVKIGYSTNPEKRVAELQTGNPRTLKLLYKMRGTPADEAALHQKYIADNVLQEWFIASADLILEFPLEGACK